MTIRTLKIREETTMLRQIIKIDQTRCNGCGLCVQACHEGAITMVEGKAVLIRDDYCDGLGDCLPACPTGAISFEQREAAEYDEAAVQANMAAKGKFTVGHIGCPGTQAAVFKRDVPNIKAPAPRQENSSQLTHWPVQIKLAPINASIFAGANLLIAADCTAFAYGDFHERFIKNHVTLIGCPKLDEGDYSEKLTQIIASNDIQKVTIVRMEVPCCGGIENAAKKALQASGKFIPWQVVTISTDGRILD